MNPSIYQAGLSTFIVIAGCVNYFVLLSIKLAIEKQTNDLKEWAREQFVTLRDYNHLEQRLRDKGCPIFHEKTAPTPAGD